MRKSTHREIVVRNPSKGLITVVPPDLEVDKGGKYIVRASNVRAEFGQLKSAPGYERVHTKEQNLDGPANLIFQPTITGVDKELRNTPLVGTSGKLYVMHRRARELVCSDCQVTFAALADSGQSIIGGDGRLASEDVANLIKGWSPGFIVHAGDLVYTGGGIGDGEHPYEEHVARFYSQFLGGYSGQYGKGPRANRFFPAPGNHDYTEGPGSRYYDFFNLPPPERYYDIKRGPCHFFFLNSNGYGPASEGPGSLQINGTGLPNGVGESDLSWPDSPQAKWLQAATAASDTAWRIAVFHHPPYTSEGSYFPGYAAMRWPWREMGIDVVICGHSHVYERIERDNVLFLTVGLGGHSKRTFVGPYNPIMLPLEGENGEIVTFDGRPVLIALTSGPVVDATPANSDGITAVEGSVFRYNGDYGALRVDVDRQRFRGRFFSRDGGAPVDDFTIYVRRASDVCYISDSARKVSVLEVTPTTAVTEVGGVFQFLATAFYSDGSKQDVTGQAAWSVGDASVLSVNRGKTTGLKPGSTTVTATYGGLSDSSHVEVLVKCEDEPLDIMLVMDRSTSMLSYSGTQKRIDRLKQAAGLMISSLQGDEVKGDRVGLISFGGDFWNQKPDTKIHANLGTLRSAVAEQVQGLSASGATAIEDAILRGVEVLTGPAHKTTHRPVMVLFTDGYANVYQDSRVPTITSMWTKEEFIEAMNRTSVAAQTAKNAGIFLVVVALDLAADPAREAIAKTWASEGFYYSAPTADHLLPIFSNVLGDLCRGGYYYGGPLSIAIELLYAP